MKVGKFLASVVFLLVFFAGNCFAMTFSQPVEIGIITAANMGGFTFKNELSNEGTLAKNGRRGVYEKGVVTFGNGDNILYFHYNWDTAKWNKIERKYQNMVMAFGDKNIENTVPTKLMYAKIFQINADNGKRFYLIDNGYDLSEETQYILIGYNNAGKWVKYFDTLSVKENYFGISNWGLAFYKSEIKNDAIIIRYYRNKQGQPLTGDNIDERGEFRFKWDDAAQWFSVEQVQYSESQVAASQAQTYVEQGENLYKSGKHREARAKYNQAISLNPKLAEAYIARSVVLSVDRLNADQVQAMKDINRAIELNPNSARAYRWRATMNIYKNPNGALADINRAIQIDSQYLDAYETRAQIYSDMKKYDQAIADYTYILDSPNFKTSYMQHYDFDMMSDWAWYIDFDQRTAALYYRRANIYAKKGDYDAAISDYNKALKLSPRNDWIKNRLRQAEEKKSGR